MRTAFAALAALWFLLPCAPASAEVVTVAFSGTIDSTAIPGLSVGTQFSGSFTYRTDLPVIFSFATFADWNIATGSLIISADGTVANTNAGVPALLDDVGVNDFGFGSLDDSGIMSGSGPLNNEGVLVTFFGSQNPAFSEAPLALPVPFPTDFTSAELLTFGPPGSGFQEFGTITSFAAVPEPGAWPLLLGGVAVTILANWRRWPRCLATRA
jgi:hypothetical protein